MLLDFHDFRGEVFVCHLQGARGDGDDAGHPVAHVPDGIENLFLGEVGVGGVEHDGLVADLGIRHDGIDQCFIGTHVGRGEAPIHPREVHETVEIVHMECEAFVHVGDEHHGGALDLALLGDLAVVGHHLGDDPGAFSRVFHVDVVLVFHEDIVTVGHPVGVAVLETGDAGGNLLALAVFHPGRVVGIGDQGFLVRQGGFGVADCIELSLELRGVVKSASCFELFRVHFRISLVETMFLLLNVFTMCHRVPRIGAHGAHGGTKAKIEK